MSTNKTKLTFDGLVIEITRRCQLQCQHCFRGDAQNVDMSREVMEALLDQTEYIDTLYFTGGEPFLNLDGMRLFLALMRERNIGLSQLQVTTNGVVRSDEAVKLLQEYFDYCRSTYKGKFINPVVQLNISSDKYHEVDYENAYNYYKKYFAGYSIFVGKHNIADISIDKRGRALKNGIEGFVTSKYYQDTKIEIISRDRVTYCPMAKWIENYSQDDIKILCIMYVSALGGVGLASRVAQMEYDNMDNVDNLICKVTDDILGAIDGYNRNKLPCAMEQYKRHFLASDTVDMIDDIRRVNIEDAHNAWLNYVENQYPKPRRDISRQKWEHAVIDALLSYMKDDGASQSEIDAIANYAERRMRKEEFTQCMSESLESLFTKLGG